jgi:hypothetical protein
VLQNTSYMGVLWHWDGQMWSSIVNDLGIIDPRACALLADHTAVIAGQGTVALYAGGITTVEHPATVPPLTQNQADFQQWYGVGTAGSKLFVVGDAQLISLRTGLDMWSLSPLTSSGEAFYGVGGPSDTEAFTVGSSGTVLKYNGSTWSMSTALPTVAHAASLWVADMNTIYVGGSDSNGAPVIAKIYR